MELLVKDVVRLLNVPENTVYAWIEEKKLPVCTVNGQIRVSKVDLLEWATQSGIALTAKFLGALSGQDLALPEMTEALERGNILYNIPGKDKPSVLRSVVKAITLPARVDRDFLLQVLLAREALGSTRVMVTNATSLPVGIKDAKKGSLALLKLYEKYQPEEFKDVVVLAMFTNTPGNLMTTKPVRTLADLKGMNLRASGGAIDILKAWGANPVGMPMPATVEALQKGVVSGLFSSLEVMKDFKFAEMCKYVTVTDTGIYPFAVIMNKEKYAALPEDVKKVFMDLKEEQSLWTGNYIDELIFFFKQKTAYEITV